jgi:hypothetical protein
LASFRPQRCASPNRSWDAQLKRQFAGYYATLNGCSRKAPPTPVNPSARNPPAAGDVFDAIDRDYLGNHKHHAKHWTATDHLRCLFENANSATCIAEIAVGGSMLLANGIQPDLGSNPATYALNAGTGVFYGAHGSLTAAVIAKTNNNDFTIKFHS